MLKPSRTLLLLVDRWVPTGFTLSCLSASQQKTTGRRRLGCKLLGTPGVMYELLPVFTVLLPPDYSIHLWWLQSLLSNYFKVTKDSTCRPCSTSHKKDTQKDHPLPGRNLVDSVSMSSGRQSLPVGTKWVSLTGKISRRLNKKRHKLWMRGLVWKLDRDCCPTWLPLNCRTRVRALSFSHKVSINRWHEKSIRPWTVLLLVSFFPIPSDFDCRKKNGGDVLVLLMGR